MKKLKGFKLLLFAMAGLGPNLMMTLVTAYLNDALQAEVANPAYTISGACLISVGLCSVLFFAAKLIDGFIDVPLAWLSDKLKCRFGKRRLSMLIGFVPMTASFLLLWNPLFVGSPVALTVAESVLLVIFYSSYTLCLVSYYGCFAHIVESDRERTRLSEYKAFFDTVQYCVAYAVFPLIISAVGRGEVGGITRTMMLLSPILLTMLIPLFLIKEEGFGGAVDESVPLWTSIKISLRSRPFRGWLATLFVMHMGLMLFLTGIGTTIPQNLLGLTKGWQITVMNSAAFAPVPLMLIIFNAVKRRRSVRTAFQTALLAFSLAMFSFAAGWTGFWGDNLMMSFFMALGAGTIGSYAIGAFFTTSYMFPSQIAANEMLTEKRDHSAMYFAVQGLVTQAASAIGVSLIYMNVINADISLMGKSGAQFLLVPVIAGALLLAAFAVSFKMPRHYASELAAKEQ